MLKGGFHIVQCNLKAQIQFCKNSVLWATSHWVSFLPKDGDITTLLSTCSGVLPAYNSNNKQFRNFLWAFISYCNLSLTSCPASYCTQARPHCCCTLPSGEDKSKMIMFPHHPAIFSLCGTNSISKPLESLEAFCWTQYTVCIKLILLMLLIRC